MDLISFLGTSDYVPVRYALGGAVTAAPERFVQAALAELLLGVRRVVVLATSDAERVHGEALRTRLAQFPSGLEVEVRPIPDGRTVEELWSVFAEVDRALSGCEGTVGFDVTHGFRSLPVVAAMAMAFRSVLVPSRVQLYYGAFEVLGAAPEVRRRLGAGEQVEAAPVFDLSPMVVLPAWAEAAAEWKRTGRARGLLQQAEPALRALRKGLAESRDRTRGEVVQRLVGSLSVLESTLSMLKHDQIGEAARDVVESIERTREVVDALKPELRPFTAVLDHVGQKLDSLQRSAGGDWRSCDPRYLTHQLDIAEWFLERGRLVEGCSVLREAMTSCAVRLAVTSGVESVERLKGGKTVSHGPSQNRYREVVDGILGCLIRGEDIGGTDEAERTLRTTLECALGAQPELLRAFKSAFEKLRDLRNKLDHCWTGEEHTKTRLSTASPPAGDLVRRVEDVKKILGSAREVVTLLTEPSSEAERPRSFVNLTNHPIETWSSSQLEGARALGLGDPTDLPDRLPLIPPDATDQDVVAMAREVADRATALNAAGAAVQGEPTFTWALVRELQSRAVRCFASTSHRDVDSVTHPDGLIERTSRQRFVRWREYPDMSLVGV